MAPISSYFIVALFSTTLLSSSLLGFEEPLLALADGFLPNPRGTPVVIALPKGSTGKSFMSRGLSYWLLLPSFCLTERWVADSLFYLSWELAFLPWDSCDLLCLSLESILVTWIDDFREAER